MLCGLKRFAEQRRLLSCVDGLSSEAHGSVPCVQWIKPQLAVYSAGLVSARGDMPRLRESANGAQRPFPDAQSALVNVEGEHDEYSLRPGAGDQPCGSLKA